MYKVGVRISHGAGVGGREEGTQGKPSALVKKHVLHEGITKVLLARTHFKKIKSTLSLYCLILFAFAASSGVEMWG